MINLARGPSEWHGPLRGRLANGLVYDFPDASDGSVRDLPLLRYGKPALAPILDCLLFPGACFYDVGANIGIYSLWASRVVGVTGEVHAFEPVQETRRLLASFIESNRAGNVTIVPAAITNRSGPVRLRTIPDASGLAHIAPGSTLGASVAEGITLDEYTSSHTLPSLIKIDVEGHELGVLDGAVELLRHQSPAIVLEVLEDHLRRAGASYARIEAVLRRSGYRIYNLSQRGLVPAKSRMTPNVLALHPRHPRHVNAARLLRRYRFARNQTT